MMNSSVCPFCNGILPALPAPPIGEKLPCPRCGEPVPAARWQVDPSLTAAPSSDKPAMMPEKGPGIRQTMLVILGIMVVMALVGLSYALWTTKLRRSRDPQVLPKPISFRKPLELSGMGYLPKGSQIVVGLQIAEMMDDKIKVGKQLLEEPRPALLDWVLKQVPRTTGLKLEEIDHLLAATSIDANFPQVVLVVKTRPAYQLQKIEEATKAKRSQHQGKPLYEVSLKPYGEALLWCVEERTLLYVIRAEPPKLEHLQGLAATERPVKELLPPPLYDALKERLAKHQLVWTVGQLDGLKAEPAYVLVAKAMLGGPVEEIKTFALGLEPVEGLTLTGSFHMTDARAAAQFKTFLEGTKIAGARSQKVEAPPPEEKEQWVTWQVRSDVAALRELMNVGKEGKK